MDFASIRHSSYSLRYVPYLDESNTSILFRPHGMKAAFQSGFRFGMLVMDFKCDCCDFFLTRYWFFQLKHSDRIIQSMNIDRVDNNMIAFDLPCATRALFVKDATDSSEAGFSDAYIIRNLVLSNDCVGFTSLFKELHEELKYRGAFMMMKKNAHRKKVHAERMAALHVLSARNIHEVGIRASIVKTARLW